MRSIVSFLLLLSFLAAGAVSLMRAQDVRAMNLAFPSYCVADDGSLMLELTITLEPDEARIQVAISTDANPGGATETLNFEFDSAGILLSVPSVSVGTGAGPDRWSGVDIDLQIQVAGDEASVLGIVPPGTEPLDPGDTMADTNVFAWDASDVPLGGMGIPNVPIGDCDPNPLPDDGDGDGIHDAVDLQPSDFSNNFADVLVGGSTLGGITERHGFDVTVTDSPDASAGVRISVAGGSDDAAAAVEARINCGHRITNVLIYPGTADFTCGSLSVHVLDSLVEWLLTNGTLVRVETGGDVTENNDGTVTANEGSTPGAVTLVDTEGNETPVDPDLVVPVVKDDCKNGGWQALAREDGTTFRNQGLCIKYVNTGR